MKNRTGLEIFMILRYNLSKFQSIQRGDRSMDEDDSVDEVIRYTLDELRFV